MHFPNRAFVLFNHRAFNGLVSTRVGWELWFAGDVENVEDWLMQSLIEVWTVLEQGSRGGMVAMFWKLCGRVLCYYRDIDVVLFLARASAVMETLVGHGDSLPAAFPLLTLSLSPPSNNTIYFHPYDGHKEDGSSSPIGCISQPMPASMQCQEWW